MMETIALKRTEDDPAQTNDTISDGFQKGTTEAQKPVEVQLPYEGLSQQNEE